ncbi:hypothetical protein NUW58_g1501 [Xylaria curta]|uniref:Uncharacterized protein n=1 Tax=Xylaria curta TaxID=42375 RepID=A0ACC1PKG0_9PEZI|nr:hypothetical protein NUW58_g1501 [Xylaria curta]
MSASQGIVTNAQHIIANGIDHWQRNGLISLTSLQVAIAGWVIYLLGLAIWRLTLSPLSDIPGPKIAALTYWYEIYYDVWLEGQYFRQIAKMHEKYGPIVRINPHEVHFNDPEFIDPLFPGPARKTDKYMFTGRRTGTQNSIVATVDHDLHRMRRNTINAFFSSASIRRLEPIMQESMANLLKRMDEAGRKSAVLPMHYVIKACTSDVITKYAFGDSFHFLEAEDYATPYMKATDVFHLFNHAMCHFPILWLEQVENIKGSPNPDRAKSTIFEGILSSKVPEEEKENGRLAHEAQLVVFAGQGTTAYTLSAALYQLLANPRILKKVKEELAQAIPQAGQIPTYNQIEVLPYFNAMMQEVLRAHPGIVSRLPRVSPNAPIVYNNKRNGKYYIIPPGTPTNMTIQIAHMNPEAFKDPYEFRPERWLEDPTLHKAFIGFARGTRNCIGMNFARQEMFIILATIIRKYDLYQGQEGPTLELYDTVLTYLQFEDIPHPALLEKGSFFRYCAQYWFAYINSTEDVDKEDRLRRMIACIINPNIYQTRVWIEHALKHASVYIDYPSDIALELEIGWLAESLLDLKFQDLECYFREDCLSKAASKGGIIENFGAEVTETLLRKRGVKLFVTSNLVRAVAANWICGSDILRELLNRWGGKIQITTGILQAAATNAFQGMKIITILLEKYGRKIDITPRVLIAAAGNWREGEALIRLLLKKGQPQITSCVLHAAATNPFEGLEIMKLLFEEYKAEMHVTPSVVTAAVDALVLAVRNETIGKETLDILIAKTTSINDVGKDGWIPIAAAASRGRLALTNDLIQNKADIMIPNRDGSTPIFVAAQNGCLDIVEFLAGKKADILQANKNGRTPIYGAALGGYLGVINFLFESKAEIDIADKAGVTAMNAAAGNGHLDVVKFLIKHKAKVTTASGDGRTPVHAAAGNGDPELTNVTEQKRRRYCPLGNNGI